MFVPLLHPPGHAQVDFGEAIGVIGGVERKIHFLAMDLPHSDAIFVVGYPAETTEAFCDGHVRAFEFFDGVPKSIAMSGFNKRKKQIDSLSGVTAWTLHDIRRTVASGLARLKTAPHVVKRILNHTTGTLGGVAGVYNRFGYLDEMREALGTWAKHVEKVTH